MEAIEKSANSTFCYVAVNRWIGIRLDALCVIFGTATCAISVAMKGKVDREQLTFVLTLVTDVIVLFSISVRMWAELQNMMTSSQRIIEYTKLESEDLLIKPDDAKMKEWPQKGEIIFEEASMRYRDGMEPSMNELSCVIQPGMKVGIVGRTGAGKSTIL
jgi:ABC-type multidrug transport system fused ATPase/permease subunit